MKTNPKKIIGLTGGIGAGKSLAGKIFSILGIPIFNADNEAKTIITNNQFVKDAIIKLLGNEAYIGTEYNKTYVAQKVFNDPSLLKKLNDIVHPAVRLYALEWALKQKSSPYLLYEAALMNAAGNGNIFDKVIVVTAPIDIRIERIKTRDKRSEGEINAIINKQMTDDQRLAFADYEIKNDEKESIIEQVLNINEAIIKNL
jgi:dephospho-CoA kinase